MNKTFVKCSQLDGCNLIGDIIRFDSLQEAEEAIDISNSQSENNTWHIATYKELAEWLSDLEDIHNSVPESEFREKRGPSPIRRTNDMYKRDVRKY